MTSRALPLLALIFAANIFFFYVNPTWNGSIATIKSAISADDSALVAADAFSKQRDKLAAARDAISPENLTALNNFLPKSVDNVGLILDLNALAARSNLLVTNIDVAQNAANASANASGQNPIGTIDLSFSASGTFSALQTFLASVEKSQRLLDVHDLTIKGSNTNIYDYHMMLRLYWLH